MALSRRELLAALGAGALMPRLAMAAEEDERVFLFFYVEGGWDPGFVFTPMGEVEGAYQEEGASTRSRSGVTWVDHPDRQAVGGFFDKYASDICLIHGLEVPSITHERSVQLLLTGSTGSEADWPTRLAGGGQVMPHLVLDGPVFSGEWPERVVRVGDSNQLVQLLEQELAPYDQGVPRLGDAVQELIDAQVLSRAQTQSGGSLRGQHATRYASSLEGLGRLRQEADGLSFPSQTLGCTRDFAADFEVMFDAFEAGLTRCAMLRHLGWCNQGWDTHQGLSRQVDNFEDLFANLYELQLTLEQRPALKERLVVVVASEMGRHPSLNAWGGKDHWTYTSLMLMGSGVRGGVMVGGLDANGHGQPVDLASGLVDSGGTLLGPEHLGATLLALGGIDDGEAIGAVRS